MEERETNTQESETNNFVESQPRVSTLCKIIVIYDSGFKVNEIKE